ncbi:MAG: 1-deoxy-D-xylulose-5-phosphate reductoisomerase [Alphaproteobacteria bacterium]
MSAGTGRTVSILGSTGSVGSSTVELIEHHNGLAPGRFRVVALAANERADLLAAQALRLRPSFVAIGNAARYAELKQALAGTPVEVTAGPEAVIEAARRDADWVMASIVGTAGLEPTLAAVRRGKTVALANKECLVSAGSLFMGEVRRHGTRLLPVDSEHNAVFQVFDAAQANTIERITLTASGGPFRTWTRSQMKGVTPREACRHPNYAMGAKISVDSATLMNKGLELIEAHFMFDTPPERLDVVVHPQQAVHCLVTYVDGSVLAQLAAPDMRTPIAYALGYPDRIEAMTRRLNLAELGQLTFEAPDLERFPCLRLAQQAMAAGNGATTVLNAANEIAVAAFLAGNLAFETIPEVVETTLDACATGAAEPLTLPSVLALDSQAREHAKRALKNASGLATTL